MTSVQRTNERRISCPAKPNFVNDFGEFGASIEMLLDLMATQTERSLNSVVQMLKVKYMETRGVFLKGILKCF